MNKISLTILASLIFSVTFSQTQIIWTDTLTFNVPATTLQTSAWTAFTASLTPRTYTKVIMRGSFDQIGQSCTDSLVATALANSLYTNTDYISPSTCNGNVWHNCAAHNFLGEVWLNPPNACDGSNCPFGYIIRPGISLTNPGNPNWGGVNTQTCSGATQRMTLIFEYGTLTSTDAENLKSLLQIFPNPFNNSFKVSLAGTSEANLTLCNVLGEEMLSQKISSGNTNIDTSFLPDGIYFVTIKTDSGIITKKIVKE